ncbi:MAG: trypsin-like peptidase domain-containing protein, partial [Aldersonia sp.]|nr:trypsin-like peptidase domain-containing protein [Aldersonia sp.]
RSEAAATTPAPPPPPAPPLDPVAVSAMVHPTLVNISVSAGPLGRSGAGTGIVLTPDGQVLTSHHVVKGAEYIEATDVGTGLIHDAEVLGYDSARDVALLQLGSADGMRAARLGDSSTVRVGHEVMAIGNAGGAGGTPTGVVGVVTDVDSTIVARNDSDSSRKALEGLIEIRADVSAGQSGGSLVDSTGSVLGVVTAASGRSTPAEGEPISGYAVPIAEAMRVVDQIRSGQPTETVHVGRTAELGVVISTVPDGVRVDVAVYGSAAYRAGIPDGAVITTVDGSPVAASKDLKAVIDRAQPGDIVRLGWRDGDGAMRETAVELVEGPPN